MTAVALSPRAVNATPALRARRRSRPSCAPPPPLPPSARAAVAAPSHARHSRRHPLRACSRHRPLRVCGSRLDKVGDNVVESGGILVIFGLVNLFFLLIKWKFDGGVKVVSDGKYGFEKQGQMSKPEKVGSDWKLNFKIGSNERLSLIFVSYADRSLM